MSRVKRGVTTHARHKKIVKMAKGYRGRSNNCYRLALQRVEKALLYAYRDRRVKKRNFRALWIQRINAATREMGMTYSTFINGLSKAGIIVDRKVMADLAMNQPDSFKSLVYEAQKALTSDGVAA
ncbi:MAG: 50S ribosomal protein L20 [Alphaproteobacteria bacterium]|nr:50S ribosomal protein L20 [Alphaproteobacteria bacterium]